MQLIINGEKKESGAKSIQALLDELGIESKVMAAAVNMNVVKKELWESYELSENDKVEFLQFVGGGA
ncbi:sulfur carrier protein ThiS [Sulfurospirillum multivorans]|uniref:Sulfur carrier protein ThiS n=2 Tax=Sulfurospirillum multivorans TaxID=66821 RepID=A0AA86DXS0_SULMK|nr:sulfur carrier protein ThiS [Sulfurospirillum multivorans]AHJ12383.1 sulfur carrier protein ThiS [Sulfurospirillum multivorans DSM 12446]QEH05881.1 sulfur carrier protein ThiS [Sulfurospirillum multivorans]